MKNKNKINEANIMVQKDEVPDYIDKYAKNKDVNIIPTNKKIDEQDGVIEPQDQATIKYLSNVKDINTGEISKPFTIGDKNYQMVRGVNPNNDVVLSVMCLDDSMIYEVGDFEKNIALPMKEMLEKSELDEIKDLGLSEYKHYVVNEKKNSFKKFKTIQELVKHGLNEGEKYMSLKEFKKFYEGKIFGKKKIDEKLLPDVSKAIDQMVKKIAPFMNKIDQPKEKLQFITTLVDKLKLDKNLVPKLTGAIKKQSDNMFNSNDTNQGMQQSSSEPIIKESIKRKTIKVIKKKDL